MIAVPGARWGLGVYVRLQVPQHNLSAFHPRGTRCPPFFGYSILKTNPPFVFVTSLLSLSTPADLPIPQVSCRGTGFKKMRGSFVAGCSTLPHPQQSQSSCYADFHRPAGCLEVSSPFKNSTCCLWVAEIPVLSRRCRQRRSMAPSRTRSARAPSLWAATFETICSLKYQQRLPIEVRGVKVFMVFNAADMMLKSEGSTRS